MHSHDYKHTADYENKRVLVVGIGNSGGDAAVELSHVASRASVCRRGRLKDVLEMDGIEIDKKQETESEKDQERDGESRRETGTDRVMERDEHREMVGETVDE